MGWRINTNHTDQWSIFSSNTDDDIAIFETEKDLVNFLALEEVYRGKKKAIETLMTFPNGWTVNNSRMVLGDEVSESRKKHEEYYKWLELIGKIRTYEGYYKVIDDKLDELMR